MRRKNFILPLALMFGVIILNDVSVANAAYVADNNAAVNQVTDGLSGGGAGFGTTFQTQLSNLSKGLLSSAKIIAVIMTAAAGCMVCYILELDIGNRTCTKFWRFDFKFMECGKYNCTDKIRRL